LPSPHRKLIAVRVKTLAKADHISMTENGEAAGAKAHALAADLDVSTGITRCVFPIDAGLA
jgi:hypothetical protein